MKSTQYIEKGQKRQRRDWEAELWSYVFKQVQEVITQTDISIYFMYSVWLLISFEIILELTVFSNKQLVYWVGDVIYCVTFKSRKDCPEMLMSLKIHQDFLKSLAFYIGTKTTWSW